MLKNLTYKQRLIVLGLGFLLGIILVYAIALSETAELKRMCNDKEDRLADITDAPGQIKRIESKLLKINHLMGDENSENVDQQELLLERVSRYCNRNKLVLKEFPQKHQVNINDYTIETYVVTMEGSFIKLLKLLYNLETNFAHGKVSSVNFSSYKNFKTKETVLQLTIYLQNIKNRNNEKDN